MIKSLSPTVTDDLCDWEMRRLCFVLNVCKAERWLTLMERNKRVQCAEDLSKFTLCHDVQFQHGLIVHLAAEV